MNDATLNKSNEVAVLTNFNFDSGHTLTINAKYLGSLASMVYQTPMGLAYNGTPASSGFRYSDTGDAYTGDVQTRMSCFNRGDFNNLMLTAELKKRPAFTIGVSG